MIIMHEFLSTVPFDLYELALFRLVVMHRSFTKAAEVARLTQSAITRQIQGMEHSLGIALLVRTTRDVRPTPAGQFLELEAGRLLGDVDRTMQHLAQEFAGARKEVRVAVSRSIGLAYLPGFFHANLRRCPQTGYRVSCQSSEDILTALETNDQDVGVLCPPARIPKTLRVTHRFADDFALIAPSGMAVELEKRRNATAREDFLKKQNWLVIEESSHTGRLLRSWMRRSGWRIDPSMQLDSFDLIINLVALGMGVSFVPIRALALYHQKEKVVRIAHPKRFSRELVVLVRKHRKLPDYLERFVTNILF